MIATIQRTGFLARVGAGLSWPASCGRSPVSVASSPRVLAASARLDRSSSSSRVSRPTAAWSPRIRSVWSRSASETRRDASGSVTRPGYFTGFMGLKVLMGRNRRRRRLLATTRTEDSVIAAAAISGLRKPSAASGTAAAL